ncbi:hypothetical protein, partial [Parvimonas sp. D9]|uniref:hypothetical protein n=1 Tax=Parvimonas sp. D9 TaxID=3110689 RepID=UPI002B4647A6
MLHTQNKEWQRLAAMSYFDKKQLEVHYSQINSICEMAHGFAKTSDMPESAHKAIRKSEEVAKRILSILDEENPSLDELSGIISNVMSVILLSGATTVQIKTVGVTAEQGIKSIMEVACIKSILDRPLFPEGIDESKLGG